MASESQPPESSEPVPPTTQTPPETSWWEDPHFSLQRLTPGQRYTLILGVILVVLLLKFGLPHVSPARPVTPTTPAASIMRPYTSHPSLAA